MMGPVQTSSRSEVHPGISFRSYEPGDIPACAHLAEDAWPSGSTIASKEQEMSGMEGYMEYSLSVSNWTDIACTSDGIVGFLFGRVDNYLGKGKLKRSLFGEIPSITKSFFEYGRMTPSLLRFLWNLVLTETKVKLRIPRSDASIEMFIVDSKHRGKGVGRAPIILIGNIKRAIVDCHDRIPAVMRARGRITHLIPAGTSVCRFHHSYPVIAATAIISGKGDENVIPIAYHGRPYIMSAPSVCLHVIDPARKSSAPNPPLDLYTVRVLGDQEND